MSYSEENGYGVVPGVISHSAAEELAATFEVERAGTRNALTIDAVRSLAASRAIAELLNPILGSEFFAVKAIMFNKAPGANWKVPWHQDCVVAVREHKDVLGWGPWSVKRDVAHVRPPAHVLENMLAVRVHLDDCPETNGALRVIPSSHSNGILTDDQIVAWPKDKAETLEVRRGDAILMRPLLLHSSSAATVPSNRRVIHIEYASVMLPSELEWNDVVRPT